MTKIETDPAKAPLSDADIERLQEQILALRAEIGRITETIGVIGKAGGENLRSRMAENLTAAKERGEANLAGATQTVEAMLVDVADHARNKPISALVTAAGIGLILGMLLGRR